MKMTIVSTTSNFIVTNIALRQKDEFTPILVNLALEYVARKYAILV